MPTMKTVAIAVSGCLLCPSFALANEPERQRRTSLREAISIEAERLARSNPAVLQSTPVPKDTRPLCIRRGTACGALIGYAIGFLVGVTNDAADPALEPMAWGLVVIGPLGAGIGAAVGWAIAAGTKPRTVPHP
jgi:hypothetical protein